ncbi:hypothetical protein Esti_004939 [Eimeria stiedai]
MQAAAESARSSFGALGSCHSSEAPAECLQINVQMKNNKEVILPPREPQQIGSATAIRYLSLRSRGSCGSNSDTIRNSSSSSSNTKSNSNSSRRRKNGCCCFVALLPRLDALPYACSSHVGAPAAAADQQQQHHWMTQTQQQHHRQQKQQNQKEHLPQAAWGLVHARSFRVPGPLCRQLLTEGRQLGPCPCMQRGLSIAGAWAGENTSHLGLVACMRFRLRSFFAGRLVGKEEPGAWDFEWDEAWRLSNASNLEQQQQKQRQNEQQQQQPTPYTRHLLLVRHAQFDNVESTDDEMQGLTPLGRLQAEVTGDRLKAILKEKKVAGVYHSNMRRARETAEIVIAKLGDAAPAVSAVQDPLLAEGVPAMPLPPSTVFHPTQATVDVDSKRIEEAFRRYFYRPPSPNQLASSSAGGSSSTSSSTSTSSSSGSNSSSKSSNEEYTILICHGNVIRYFFCSLSEGLSKQIWPELSLLSVVASFLLVGCRSSLSIRALQLPPNAWLRLATFNCGITWLTIDRRGYVSARQFGDVGHLSPSLITYR